MFALELYFVLPYFEKWGHTVGRTTCEKTMIPTGRDYGLAEWIKKTIRLNNAKRPYAILKSGTTEIK